MQIKVRNRGILSSKYAENWIRRALHHELSLTSLRGSAQKHQCRKCTKTAMCTRQNLAYNPNGLFGYCKPFHY